MSIRIAALFAAVTGVLGLAWPAWGMVQHWPAQPIGQAIISAAFLLLALFAPLFYFALWRNESPLYLDSGLRRMALLGAIAFGVIVVVQLRGMFAVLDAYMTRIRAFGFGMDPDSLGYASSLLGDLSNIAFALLLIAFFAAPSGSGVQSSFLEIVSRIYVLIAGLFLVFSIVQAGGMQYTLWMNRNLIRSEQVFGIPEGLLFRRALNLIVAGCIFIAPYIVCMSRRLAAAQVPAEAPPQENQPGIEALDQPS